MKVLEINICPDLSTGTLMMDIACRLNEKGEKCLTAAAPKYCDDRDTDYRIGSMFERHVHILLGQLCGSEASFSQVATFKLLKFIKKYNPDIIHLHNIHQYYINLKILFTFLMKFNGIIIWTFHDCWPFTGACHHYIEEKCFKWIDECRDCPYQKKLKIKPFVNTSYLNLRSKKKLFKKLKKLYIVTPSYWLAGEVKKSFLGNYPIYTVWNGIDTTAFRYIASDIKNEFGISDKKVILGVASHWSKNKGLADFEILSNMLDPSYIIVLIGVSDSQIRKNNLIFLPRTNSKEELAKWYSAADVYCNLSTEETFGLVVAEAMACGTPVIVYNSTALPELVVDTESYVCEPHDLKDVKAKIEIIIQNGREKYSETNRNKVIKCFASQNTAQNYIDLFYYLMKGNVNND